MLQLLLIILLISASECIGQSCLKKFFQEPDKIHLFIIAILFYSLICYLLVLSYKYKGIGLVNVIWSGISVLLMVSIGVIMFHEKITNLDIIGIILIVVGIMCVMKE